MTVGDGDDDANPGEREPRSESAPRRPSGAGRPTASRGPAEIRAWATFSRWPELLGSAAVLLPAGIVAAGIAFGAKEACRTGAWSLGVEQYQAHCYTDIYPLYYIEGLSAHEVPYFDHHVE